MFALAIERSLFIFWQAVEVDALVLEFDLPLHQQILLEGSGQRCEVIEVFVLQRGSIDPRQDRRETIIRRSPGVGDRLRLASGDSIEARRVTADTPHRDPHGGATTALLGVEARREFSQAC